MHRINFHLVIYTTTITTLSSFSCHGFILPHSSPSPSSPSSSRLFSADDVNIGNNNGESDFDMDTMTSSTTSSTSTSSSFYDKPYGTWPSPITSKAITAGTVRLSGLSVLPARGDDDDAVYWLEGRPNEGGRTVLCRCRPSSDGPSAVDVTPVESNVRTRVHEYGGGAVVLGREETEIFYSEFAGQRVCRLIVDDNGGGRVGVPVSVEGDRYRYADGVLSRDGSTVYCIREDHLIDSEEGGGATPSKDVVNEIVALRVSDGSMTVVATGNDFYSNPRLNPEETELAYVTWNHPNMPWDATELRVRPLANEDGQDDAKTSNHRLVAGHDGDTSVIQPLYHPHTGMLYYLSDQSGYYNLYRAGGARPSSILPVDSDFGGTSPGWTLGQQGFRFLPDDGRLVAHYPRDGRSVLLVADVRDPDKPAVDIVRYDTHQGLPRTISDVVPGSHGTLYLLGAGPATPPAIYRWNPSSPSSPEILRSSSKVTFPDSLLSTPTRIEFPTSGGLTSFGYHYPPKNDRYRCTTESSPPLLVKAHGGPTSCASTAYDPSIQFWTSRGFSVLDVDYSGSTGYGKDYRRRLRRRWGVADVDDVCAGAAFLAQRGLADPQRSCIDGRSAGGFTVLGALTFRDVFRAGTSSYGIGDLTALAGDTHKFESRYLDGLVGRYPEEEELYRERSPIEHVEKLSCPVLILQGEEDRVVPPNQARKMHEALLTKGIPTCLKVYEGEQHGFRKAENIEDALDRELAFYGKVFGMEGIPGVMEIEVDNL